MGTGGCGFYHRASAPEFPYVGPPGSSGVMNPEQWGTEGEWAYNLNDGTCSWNGDGCGYFFGNTYDTYSIQALVTVSGQPTNFSVVADTEQITVVWDPPANNGGSEITWYTVQSDQLPGVWCHRAAVDGVRQGDPCMFGAGVGVTSGVSYTFSIVAENSFGVSEPLISEATSLFPATQQITMNLNSESCSTADAVITENGITVDFEVANQWGGFSADAVGTNIDGTCGYENAIWRDDSQNDVEFGFTNNDGYTCLRLTQISIAALFNGMPAEMYGTLQLDNVILHLLKNGSIVSSVYTGISIAAGGADTNTPAIATVTISDETCDIDGLYVETVQSGGDPDFTDPFHFFYDNLIFTAHA
jgi:hypothetical protein